MKKNRGRDILISLGIGLVLGLGLVLLVTSLPEAGPKTMAAREEMILNPLKTVLFFSIIAFGILRLIYNLRGKKSDPQVKDQVSDN